MEKRGEDAWRVVRTDHRDLAILDADLPGKSGTWVLQQIRETARKLPVVVTSAHADDELEAELLKRGADGLVRKPFHIGVLLGRVAACLRRVPPAHRTHIHVGELVLCLRKCTVRLNGRSARLARKEHEILAVLAERPGQTVPREELMQRVWGRDDAAQWSVARGQWKRRQQHSPGTGPPWARLPNSPRPPRSYSSIVN